jgi:hypothetical protein
MVFVVGSGASGWLAGWLAGWAGAHPRQLQRTSVWQVQPPEAAASSPAPSAASLHTPAPAPRPPTSLPCAASAKASWEAKVLLPTPPLPDSTSTLCFTEPSRALMATRSAAAGGPRAQE